MRPLRTDIVVGYASETLRQMQCEILGEIVMRVELGSEAQTATYWFEAVSGQFRKRWIYTV